ncbi:MAG TPA: hypothetical protein VE444_01025 [Gaiellaceae bacterium]|nr:hypothetical protein [Gaiellaceae bacterium]
MARVYVEELLRAPVLLHGIQLGRPVDVVLDKDRRRVLGLEIHCGDESRRFLPITVLRLGEAGIELASPLVMLEGRELAFYTQRGSTLSALRNADVEVGGKRVGSLVDVQLDADGTISELVVRTEKGKRHLWYGPRVALLPRPGTVRAAS